MISSNVIHRVFHVQRNSSFGTAFTIDVNGREYMVTARHVVEGLTGDGQIAIESNHAWVPTPIHLVGHAADDVDISVLALDRVITPMNLPMKAASDGIAYGQGVYFLGFPFGGLGNIIFGPDGYPLPFVKRAILSQFDGTIYYLDGHNNPGFSGGPVVFAEPRNNNFQVAAIISGYLSGTQAVYQGPQNTGLTHSYNTGIIKAHKIDEALKLISNNPIGCKL